MIFNAIKIMDFILQKVSNSSRHGMLAITMPKSLDFNDDTHEAIDKTYEYETPICLQYTRNGVVPHLCWDLMHHLDDNVSPSLVTLPGVLFMKEAVEKYGKGFAKYAGFDKARPIFMTVNDPLRQIKNGFNNDLGIAIFNHTGKEIVIPGEYVGIQKSFQTQMVQALADSDTPKNASKKRLNKSVRHSLKMLDDCIELGSKNELSSAIFGTIEGGYDSELRIISAKESSQKSVHGFILDGFHTNSINKEPNLGTNIEMCETESILNDILKLLPNEKPRAMFGAFSPQQILRLISCGVDIFDSSFGTALTERKIALLPLFNENSEFKYEELDLTEDRFKDDFNVISNNCECYTCSKHFSRAYIHHLINTDEMLNLVLLNLHNLHTFYRFFQKIREFMKNDSFSEIVGKIKV